MKLCMYVLSAHAAFVLKSLTVLKIMLCTDLYNRKLMAASTHNDNKELQYSSKSVFEAF